MRLAADGSCSRCQLRIYRMMAKMAEEIGARCFTGQLVPPRATSAAESALRLRPRRALSSAQPSPLCTTITSPDNDFSLNGAYPLNSVSHSRGSLHSVPSSTGPTNPFSITPAVRNARTSLSTLLSATRRAMAAISLSWLTRSEELLQIEDPPPSGVPRPTVLLSSWQPPDAPNARAGTRDCVRKTPGPICAAKPASPPAAPCGPAPSGCPADAPLRPVSVSLPASPAAACKSR